MSGAAVIAAAAGAAAGALGTPWLRNSWVPNLPTWQLPLALAATAGGVVAGRHGSATPALLVTAIGAAILAVVDARRHRLPTRMILVTLAAAAVALGYAGLVDGVRTLGWAVLGGVGYAALLAAMRGAARGAAPVGLGDVRFAVPLGLTAGWLGPTALLVTVAGAFVAGGVVALVLLATRRAQRTDRIPFGPFMAAGWLAAVAMDWSRWW